MFNLNFPKALDLSLEKIDDYESNIETDSTEKKVKELHDALNEDSDTFFKLPA